MSNGLSRLCWRIRLRTGVGLGLAWLAGVGLGLGWGVVLARSSTCPDARPLALAQPCAQSPLAQPPSPAPGSPTLCRLPEGTICYPASNGCFSLPPLPPKDEPSSQAKNPDPKPYVTRSTTTDASPAFTASGIAEAAPERREASPPVAPAEPRPALDPEEVARVRADLDRVRAYHEQTAQIQALAEQARTAEAWVLRAIMAQELANLHDPRVIEPLTRLLGDSKDEVVYFTLLGLAEYSGEDLRRGNGPALAEALLRAARRTQRDVRAEAYRLLARLSGESFASRPTPWKRWIDLHRDELLDEGLVAPVFDEAAYDPRAVARVRTGGGTRVRRDPSQVPGSPVFSKLSEVGRHGLDLVVCLDQTSSMESVIEAAKGNLGVFSSVLGALVKDHRLGLVCYKDDVTRKLSLGKGAKRFRDSLGSVHAEGGGDVEEGVDKALAASLQSSMGWHTKATKVVVLVGDAPPHAPDSANLLVMGKQAHEKQGVVIHAVDCGGIGNDVKRLVRNSEGTVVHLTSSETLIYQILGVVFGEALRPALERFLGTYLDWARRS